MTRKIAYTIKDRDKTISDRKTYQRKTYLRKAYHEAGHAVMAVHMGLHLGHFATPTGGVGLSLVPDKTRGTLEYYSGGRTNVSIVPVWSVLSELPECLAKGYSQEQFVRFRQDEVECFAMVSLAGEAAQRLFSPRSFRKVHVAGDYLNVTYHMSKGFMDDGARARRIAELKQTVRKVVVIRWPIITEVAELLFERIELGAVEAENLIIKRLNERMKKTPRWRIGSMQ